MTEDMEKKLNELLGLKKQLEEITAEKKKADTTSEFEGKKSKTLIYFYVCFTIFLSITLIGLIGLFMNTGKNQIISLFSAIVGFEGTVLMRMWYHTVASRLAILQEKKQLELRITEMLKKP